MTSNRQRLRRGESLDLEPGVKIRLSPKDKMLEYSDGRKLPLSEKDQRDLFPKDTEAYRYALQREDIKEGTEGGAGQFFHQYMQKSIPGKIKEWYDKATLPEAEFQRKRKASQEVSEEISEEHPWISGAATAADIGTDVAATLGTGGGLGFVRGAATGAGLSLAHAGPRMLEEPGQVLGEAGISGLGAGLINKFTGGVLNKVAARRSAARALPAQKEAVRTQNVAGKAAMDQSNLAKEQQIATEKLHVKNENIARADQNKINMRDYNNRAIQAKNDWLDAVDARRTELQRLGKERSSWKTEDKLAVEKRDQEIKLLKDDYELKNQQYKDALQKHPELQRKAQAEHGQNVQKSVNEIVETIPAETKIHSDLIGVGDFIGEKITPTAMGGTGEATQVSKILRSLFPEGESFTAKELGKKYGLLEDAIKDSRPAVSDYLSRFKEHLGDRIPSIVKDNTVHAKLMPILAKQIEKDIAEAVKKISLPFSKNNAATRNAIAIKANDNLRRLLQEIGPENFAKKLQSGEIAKTLNKGILTADDLLISAGVNNAAKLRKSGEFDVLIKPSLNKAHKNFVNEISRGIEESLYKNDFKAMELGVNAEKRLGEALKKTFGMAPPIEPPIAPHAPGSAENPLPPEYVAPQRTQAAAPPKIDKPRKEPLPDIIEKMPEPGEPDYGQFTATPPPELPPAQGFAEHAGDFLEKPMLGKGGMGSANLLKNPLGRLGGALGALHFLPGAKAGAAAYLAAKGLTSPTAGGAMARMTFRQGGIQAIVSWAQKYPSFHDGVLENPQERRSLTREIEDDPDMPLEQKAIIQSKVNRGKPLEGNLH